MQQAAGKTPACPAAGQQRASGSTLLVDTRMVSAGDRVAFWASSSSEAYHPLRIQAESAQSFSARMWGDWLDSVGLFRVSATTNTMSRTRNDIAAGDPECLQLSILVRGHLEGGQRHMCTLEPGDMTAYDTSQPVVFHAPGEFELLALRLPKAALGGHGEALTRLCGLRFAAGTGLPAQALRIFRDSTAGLTGADTDHAAATASRRVTELVRQMSRLADAPSPGRAPTRVEVLLRARRHIEEHLGDPGLNPEQIARACFISTRYLHRVFADEGRSVCEWIRTERLARCRRDLLDPALGTVPVAAIARRWGLSSASHFSRLFRDAHGCPPREFRRSAVAGHPVSAAHRRLVHHGAHEQRAHQQRAHPQQTPRP